MAYTYEHLNPERFNAQPVDPIVAHRTLQMTLDGAHKEAAYAQQATINGKHPAAHSRFVSVDTYAREALAISGAGMDATCWIPEGGRAGLGEWQRAGFAMRGEQ